MTHATFGRVPPIWPPLFMYIASLTLFLRFTNKNLDRKSDVDSSVLITLSEITSVKITSPDSVPLKSTSIKQ
jgi:hypothetical protein